MDSLQFVLNYIYLDVKNFDGSVEICCFWYELGLLVMLVVLGGWGQIIGDLCYVLGNYDSCNFGDYVMVVLLFYNVVNLLVGYDVIENLCVIGWVVNLFDQDYFDVWGYVLQGCIVYVGLQVWW